MEQRILQDAHVPIGENIRRIRKQKKIKQVDLVARMNVMGIHMTREMFGKIERGVRHVGAYELYVIRELLGTDYEELLKLKECDKE